MNIEIKELTKKFGNHTAVDHVTLSVPENRITVLIGSSGCGKTTLLKMMNRLIEPSSGDIFFGKESFRNIDPIELRRKIGYVIQEIGLFPHMNIKENISIVPKLLKWDKKKIDSRVIELLDLVNLDPSRFLKLYPAQLSGGQRQRVGVARALAADPGILLMDEPFGAIDPINREMLQDNFLQIQENIKKTVVFVTHDIHEAIKLGDNIAVLDEGKLLCFDKPVNIIRNPESQKVKDLFSSAGGLKSLEYVQVSDYLEKEFPKAVYSNQTVSLANCWNMNELHHELLIVVDQDEQFMGCVEYGKKLLIKRDPTGFTSVPSISVYGSLIEAVSIMMLNHMTWLPVIDHQNKLKGRVRLKTIMQYFSEISQPLNFGENK